MAKDDFKNLGFKEPSGGKKAADEDKGAKGELRW